MSGFFYAYTFTELERPSFGQRFTATYFISSIYSVFWFKTDTTYEIRKR